MKRMEWKRVVGVLVAAVLAVTSAAVVTVQTPVEVEAAKKPYGDKLKLNNDIKVNKTTTFTKIGLWKEDTSPGQIPDGYNAVFSKEQKGTVEYTITCKKKSSGKNYIVTYDVEYKFLDDPQVENNENVWDEWYWRLKQPDALYTVFDYETGKSLEGNNKLGVKVTGSEWERELYPRQTVATPDFEDWYANYKSIKYSFTVKYPKKCKNVVVGIGFSNREPVYGSGTDHNDNKYWDGKVPYGKTTYYKGGKKTMSYMRLK